MDVVLKGNDDRHKDPQKDDQDRNNSPKRSSNEGAINTIFGGPYIGRSSWERLTEVKKGKIW